MFWAVTSGLVLFDSSRIYLRLVLIKPDRFYLEKRALFMNTLLHINSVMHIHT